MWAKEKPFTHSDLCCCVTQDKIGGLKPAAGQYWNFCGTIPVLDAGNV